MKRFTYARYKDSGVEWLGQVPYTWKVCPLKWESSVKRGASPRPIDDPMYFDEDGEYAWVRISDVTAAGMYLETTEQKLSSVGSSLSVKLLPGSLFLSIAATVGKPCIAKIKCCIHDGFVYFPHWKGDPRFLFYIFASGEPYKGLGKLGTQLNLNTDTVGSIVIAVPSIEEQVSIADFLDTEITRIDCLLNKKKELISILTERCNVLTNQAVTKGLVLSANMKDSGLPWFGQIPEHWELKRQRFIMTMSGGMTPDTENTEFWEDGEIPWVSPKDMKVQRLSGSIDRLTAQALEKTSIRLYSSGRVLIVVRGMILAHTFPVAINDVPVTVNQDMKVIETCLNAEYLAILLRGIQDVILSIVEEAAHGTKVLRTDLFKNIHIPVPPLEEQENIVNHVRQISSETERVVNVIRAAISSLEEYRTGLITSAVTGKIDLRRIQVGAQEDGNLKVEAR